MNKHEIIKTLQSGICEITIADENGIESTLMATKAPQHLPDGIAQLSDTTDQIIWVFNVNTETQQSYMVDSVIDIEQLTGEGAAVNESKLKASPEYMEQLDLFSDEEFDELEHPDDMEGAD
jgi:hypothetical protein